MNTADTSFRRALIVGTVLQLAMVLAGHWIPFIKNNLFAIGGLTLSLLAGALYSWGTPRAWRILLANGALVGGACALIGIAVSFALRDVPAAILLVGTAGSTVTGSLGALIAGAASVRRATT